MRRKSLWKNLMLATALTVVLGTAPVTAFAADVDSTVTEAEQTTPQADTTVKEEVAEPEVKAITVDVTTSSTTFDGTQDIVITYTVNGVQDGFEPYQDIPWFDGHPQDVIEENVSDTVYKFTITKAAQQACIERNNATDGQIFVFDSKYSTGAVDFPTVTLTYTTGDNGDNGNGETPEKPENPDPDNGNGGNGNGETPEKPENPDPENPDNGNGDNNNGGDNGDNQKPENPDPENPDNGNGDNNNGGQTPETPDNGNGQTPETPDNGNSNTNNQTTAKPTTTSPKTGDATATLPVAGTGLASLGVALATVLRKRK